MIEEEWRELHRVNCCKSSLRSFEFINLWYDCFSEPNQVRIYRVRDQDQTVGFIPFVLRVRKGTRVLESLTNDHCLHSDPLVRNGYEAAFQRNLAQILLQRHKQWDLMCHSFSYSFSQLPGLFSKENQIDSRFQWRQEIQPTYTILLNKSFEDYFHNDISSKLRSNFKRGQNSLKEAGTVNFSHTRGLEAIKHWPQFLTLEDSGWKGKGGTSIKKTSNSIQQYYSRLINILAHHGALHMYFLELSGEPIAGVFGYIEQDIFHYAKIGYNENFSKFNPSNTLLIYIIKDLIENYPEVKRFNMFPWDYNYKHRYANEEPFFLRLLYILKPCAVGSYNFATI
jgi:CelD/BcsL family acetyltransferase involved in cellulose biosynthesis